MMERVESEGLVSPANGKGAEGLLAVHKHDAFRWENAMRHDQHSAPLGEPRPNISKRKNHYKRYYTASLQLDHDADEEEIGRWLSTSLKSFEQWRTQRLADPTGPAPIYEASDESG